MYFSSVGHTESCKNVKKKTLFSWAGTSYLISSFIYHCCYELKYFWYFGPSWRHLRQISPCLVSSSGLGGLAIQMPVMQELLHR